MNSEFKKIEKVNISGKERNLYSKKGSKAKFIICKGEYIKLSDFLKSNKPKNKKKGGAGGMFDGFFGKKADETTKPAETADDELIPIFGKTKEEVSEKEKKILMENAAKKVLINYYSKMIIPIVDTYESKINTYFIDKQNAKELIILHSKINPTKKGTEIIKEIKKNISNYLLKEKCDVNLNIMGTCVPIEKYFDNSSDKKDQEQDYEEDEHEHQGEEEI